MMATPRGATRRLTTWGAILAGLATLFVLAVGSTAIEVDVGDVARRPLQVTVDHEGKTRVRDRYLVSAPVAGRVRRIDLRPGDRVTGGQTVVATFEPATPMLLDARTRAEATARLRAAQTTVTQARAALAESEGRQSLATRDRDRIDRLFANGLVSKADRDQADTAASTAVAEARASRAAVATAEHQLDAARAALLQGSGAGGPGELAIHAPITGVVLQRLHESAATVPAGEPLIEVGNPADLEVVADYLSSDAVTIRAGMPALVDRWGGGEALRARVTRVEPFGFLKISALGVEEQRVNVIAELDDPRVEWQALGDGYRVEMRVVLWSSRGVLTVPTSALFRQRQEWAVFVVAGGRAHLRRVGIGHRTGEFAEVTSGLQESDRVVVRPPDTVADGARVSVTGTE